MKRHLALAIATAAVLPALASLAVADSWIFRPSAYSHDPATGVRVSQYLPAVPAYVRGDDTYVQSGYRHRRSSLRGADGSVDRLHVVETWGAGEAIRPYGEWQRPFRAGATPYGPWGNSQGPWTLPFDSWVNPYGAWNRFNYGHHFPDGTHRGGRGHDGGGHDGSGHAGGGHPDGGSPGGSPHGH